MLVWLLLIKAIFYFMEECMTFISLMTCIYIKFKPKCGIQLIILIININYKAELNLHFVLMDSLFIFSEDRD